LLSDNTDSLKNNIGITEPSGKELASTFNRMIIRAGLVDLKLGIRGFMVNRHEYGQRLLKSAASCGVEIRANSKAVSAITDDDIVKGAVIKTKEGELFDIYAKVTIDCTGRNYQIRKTLPENHFPMIEKKMDKKDVAASYREIIQLKKGDHQYNKKICLEYREDIPDGGYFWIFGKGSQSMNVGIGWFTDVKSHKTMKNHFWDILHEYYKPDMYNILEKGGFTIPMRYPLLNAVASGFITAGDAAFHTNPFSAEGHASALIAGYYAGNVAANAVEEGDYRQEVLWKYNKHILNDFGLTHIKYQLILEALKEIKYKGLEFLLKRSIFSGLDFSEIMQGKNIDFLTSIKILLKSFPRLDILYKLSKVTRNAQFFDKMIRDYPSNPESYPKWFKNFISRMNNIRN